MAKLSLRDQVPIRELENTSVVPISNSICKDRWRYCGADSGFALYKRLTGAD